MISRVFRLSVLGFLLAATAAHAQGANARRPTLALMNFTNSALINHADYDPLEWSVPEMISTRLARNVAIEVVDRRRLQALLDEQKLGASGAVDESSAARIGQVLGARYMVFGTVVIDRRNRMRVDARVLEVETSKIIHTETFRDADWNEDVNFIVDSIAERLNRNLKLPGRIPVQPPDNRPRPIDSVSSRTVVAATNPVTDPPTATTAVKPKAVSRNAGIVSYGIALRLIASSPKNTAAAVTMLQTAALETPSLARDVEATLRKVQAGAP